MIERSDFFLCHAGCEEPLALVILTTTLGCSTFAGAGENCLGEFTTNAHG